MYRRDSVVTRPTAENAMLAVGDFVRRVLAWEWKKKGIYVHIKYSVIILVSSADEISEVKT